MKAAMKLSMIERRVKHRRQNIEVEKISNTNSVKDCTYTVLYDSGGRPSLVLCAEVLSDVSFNWLSEAHKAISCPPGRF